MEEEREVNLVDGFTLSEGLAAGDERVAIGETFALLFLMDFCRLIYICICRDHYYKLIFFFVRLLLQNCLVVGG